LNNILLNFIIQGRISDSKPPINAQHQKQSNIKNPAWKNPGGGQVQGSVYGGLLAQIRLTGYGLARRPAKIASVHWVYKD
jgi:hypothetical protein